ncbi:MULTISPECIES: hypothetical protein [Streptomyces]|uniref:SMI1/KNR4 family protein n=2 Tax=Streptomyces TaxID=1883 RepID=A0ABV9IWQ3_9ACTN
MERLVSGETLGVQSGHLGVVVSEKGGVWIHGCDCSAPMSGDEVSELHDALGAFLRRQKNKETRNG